MSCTIIIFHFESLAYLRGVVRKIREYQRADIPYHIIVADQSVDRAVIDTLYKEFCGSSDLTVVHIDRCGSGYSVDHIMRVRDIDTEFVCTIDVDTIPIHKNWLYVPIRIIQETGIAFVGVHAEIEHHYGQMPGTFYCLCQHFRVGRTNTYKDLSLNGGFVKNDSRRRFSYGNTEWHGWSDDAISAHWWEDQYRKNNKLGLAVSHFLGSAPTEGMFGRYTDDLVFHFGFSYNWKMVRNKQECMGSDFLLWMHRMETEGLSDAMIEEILSKKQPLVAPIGRTYWDANSKTISAPNSELNTLIDKLKTE